MTPEERTAYAVALRARETAGERLTLVVGPFTRAMMPGIVWYVTQNGPQPDVIPDDELRKLIRREKAGERAEVPIGPFAAMQLIRGIQGIVKHSPAFAAFGPEMFAPLLDQLKLMFVDDPRGGEVILNFEKNSR
ncbi:hypothetical protein [Amycolatopsis kentuckyensis]|uniref:hypothetical protein n=1 Tax=Amycolatopsis kentuckyensis TaxID=218823 RepID=UPI00356896DC